MEDAFGDLIFYLLFSGSCQALFAAGVAVVILPLFSLCSGRPLPSLLGRFVLFNGLLLFWGAFGNALWLHLTGSRFAVLDDVPVWTPFFPPFPSVFDHAGGGRDTWELRVSTTFRQLYGLWGATALPVWPLAMLSFLARGRFFRGNTDRTQRGPGDEAA